MQLAREPRHLFLSLHQIIILYTQAVDHDVVGAASGGDPVPDPPFRRGRAVCAPGCAAASDSRRMIHNMRVTCGVNEPPSCA